MAEEKKRPVIETKLRHNILDVPEEARKASGIVIFGRRIKTLVFTTDLAIIRNCNADAVFAVYPFTPQTAIGDAIIKYPSICRCRRRYDSRSKNHRACKGYGEQRSYGNSS